MRKTISGAALLATFALAGPVAAQQGEHTPAQAGMHAAMMAHMHAMDSLGARVDSALARMNRTRGENRVNAMAEVLNALAAERKAMHAHMHEMHSQGGGMMGKAPAGPEKPHEHQAPAADRPDTSRRR